MPVRNRFDALDATGSADDRTLSGDVRGFLDKHEKMNATPEVFAARYAQLMKRAMPSPVVDAAYRPASDKRRSR